MRVAKAARRLYFVSGGLGEGAQPLIPHIANPTNTRAQRMIIAAAERGDAEEMEGLSAIARRKVGGTTPDAQ